MLKMDKLSVSVLVQSRVHCTRLAGNKADIWHLRQAPQVLNLPFKPDVRRPDRDNAIDVYISDEYMDLLGGDDWKRVFTEKPPVFTKEEKRCLARSSKRRSSWL